MLVDGKRFVTYELDSKETIKDRIAMEKKLLPEHMIVTFSKDENDQDIATTVTIPDLMNKYKRNDFKNFYEDNKEDFKSIDFDAMANLWYIFALQNGENSDPYIEHLLDEYLVPNRYSIDKIKDNIKAFNDSQKAKLNLFISKVKNEIEMAKDLERYDQVHTTPVEVVKVKTEISFEVDYDIFELFNYVKMSRDVPFAVIGEYYKILKDFIPSDPYIEHLLDEYLVPNRYSKWNIS